VYFLLLFGTTALFGKTDPAGGKSLTGWLGFLSMFGWWFVVIILPEATLGYTLGKGTFSLRVISLKPNRPGWLVTIIRHIFDLIELCMFGGLVSVILIKTSALHQRIGDLAAGSTVVHDDR
jgi:uncharacterized RDD family membrane protein YckC